jgi:tetratricopeptide (TPR) repeat protein
MQYMQISEFLLQRAVSICILHLALHTKRITLPIMVVHKREASTKWRSNSHLQPNWLLMAVLFLVVLELFSFGCAHKAVRVAASAISEEAMKLANAASLEGDAAFNRKDYYPALIKYLEAVRLNPNSELWWNRLGIIYSQLKYYQEAAAAFQRSIQLNPKYVYAVNNLGSAYFAKKELKKAEKNFKKAIRMNNKEASFHMNLGALYFEKKKPEKALAEWRNGLALNPNIFDNNNVVNLSISGENSTSREKAFLFARIHALSGNVPKAIQSLEEAVLNGFTDIHSIYKNPDFDPIRKDERFIEFMKKAFFWISQGPKKNNDH